MSGEAPAWENETDYERRMFERGEGWHDEYGPAELDHRVDFKQPFKLSGGAYDPPTVAEVWELKVKDGDCPRPGCSGRLDTDFYCSGCGRVSLPQRPATEEEEAA